MEYKELLDTLNSVHTKLHNRKYKSAKNELGIAVYLLRKKMKQNVSSNPSNNNCPLPTDKIFDLLESKKYGWDKIRSNTSTAQQEIYMDVMRATAEALNK